MRSNQGAVCLLALALALPAWAEEPGAVQPAAPEVRQPTDESKPAAGEATPAGAAAAPAAAVPAERARKGDDKDFGESISVTATRSPRRTRDVPQAISVVGKEQMEDKVVFNMRDVVQGTPGVLIDTKNGGYDARLLIRGAGLKASYGVREIMVLRDGVPLTDPDSFTRLDFVDMQDVERIEIAKGPGNLFSPGSAGGAIQILSRSVFDPGADTARASFGTYGSGTAHLRTSGSFAGNALALTASYRQQDNAWRSWNEFKTFQASLKHGVQLDDGAATIESEVAYTQADTQLPGVMDRALYDTFVETGEQAATSEPWKNSGRYSNILYANSKYEHRLGALVLKPRAYYTQWTHYHPVTGAINETEAWTRVLGTDLEAQHGHVLLGAEGTLVAGVTAKGEWNPDSRKYEYRDVVHAGGVPTGRITSTLSDEKGALMETQDQRNLLLGVFVQESLRPHERVLVDLGFRYDRSWFDVEEDQTTRYDYARGTYVPGDGLTTTRKTFDLPAPKAGVSVRLTQALSVYGAAARASQIPSMSEITSNPDLDAAVTTSYEAGVKARTGRVVLDLGTYWMGVEDEIVSLYENGETVFQNAGETEKRGVEASASFRILAGLEVGASYAWADYHYVSYSERVQTGTDPVTGRPVYGMADRSGNRLPFIPRHQYGAFASWRHPSGFRVRVQSNTWGDYWVDSANSETYSGYAFLTSVGAGWAFGRHELVLDVENALDQRYAMEVRKDNATIPAKVTYAAGTPRYVSFGYRFGL